MSKKSVLEREKKRIRLNNIFNSRREYYKTVIKNSCNNLNSLYSEIKLQKLPRNSMKIRLRKRCYFTGRPRGVLKKFMISRNLLRDMLVDCKISGLLKSSW